MKSETRPPATPHTPPRVTVRIGQRQIEVPYCTPVGEVLRQNGNSNNRGHPVLAAIVHQRCVDLS